MTETWNSDVVITLGRSGQMVKKAGNLSERRTNDPRPPPGMKRSVRDRLGNSIHDSLPRESRFNRKRLGHVGDAKGMNGGLGIAKDDLRFKLMRQKKSVGVSERKHKFVDLREKLSSSRRAAAEASAAAAGPCLPRPSSVPLPLPLPPPMMMAREATQPRLAPPPDPSWTLDRLRQQSCEKTAKTGPPPPMAHGMMMNSGGGGGFVPSISYTPTHPYSLAPPTSTPFSPLPTSLIKEEQLTVDALLQSLELKKYSILFKAEEVDMAALKQMGDSDLKEMGIPMGPRKKILLALMSPLL